MNAGMPLPFPAHNFFPVPIALDRLPKPCKAEGPFAPNTLLRKARRLFEGQVVGSGAHLCCSLAAPLAFLIFCASVRAESVAVAPDGRLWMLDRYGYVWTASGDQHDLDGQPLAYVGPGRPLGFHHTPTGDLIICDSLKAGRTNEWGSVGAQSGACS
jgi:hypothetical protein